MAVAGFIACCAAGCGMSDFVSLKSALEKYYTEPFDGLPEELRERVRCSFPTKHWDDWTPNQRHRKTGAAELEGCFEKNWNELTDAQRKCVHQHLHLMLWDKLTPEQRERSTRASELMGHFDKNWDELADEQRKCVQRASDPFHWDMLTPDQRRHRASEWDYQHDPAIAQKVSEWNALHAHKDENNRQTSYFERLVELDLQIKKWESLPVPSPSEQEKMDAKIALLEAEKKALESQWYKARGDFHSDQAPLSDENEPSRDAFPTACQPVFARQIRQGFRVYFDNDQNDKWWRLKMRAGADNRSLVACRVGEAKKGPGDGTLWRPDLIAGWLVDEYSKGHHGLSQSAAHAALRKFPGCESIADDMFPPDE